MKKRIMNMQTLIQNNKKEIISNKESMDIIEKKIDEKLKGKVIRS
jgi:hypothetical protein